MLASNDDQLFLTDSQYDNAQRRKLKMESLGDSLGRPIKTQGKILDVSFVISKIDASHQLCAWIAEAGHVVRKMKVQNGKVLGTLKGHSGPVTQVVVDLNSPTMISGEKEVQIYIGRDLNAIERFIYTCSWDKTIKKWDPLTFTCLQTWHGHSDLIKSLCLLDSNTLVSGAGDGTIRVWDTETGKCLRVIKALARSVEALSLAPCFDNQSLFWAGSSDGSIRLWNAKTGEMLEKISGHDTNITQIKTIFNSWYRSSHSSLLYPLDPTEEEERKDVEQDVNWILTSSTDKTGRQFVKDKTWTMSTRLEHDDFVKSLAAVPGSNNDVEYLVSGGRDEDVYLWTRDGELITRIPGHVEQVSHVAVLPSNVVSMETKSTHVIVSASLDGTLRTWSLDTKSIEEYKQATDKFKELQPVKEQEFVKKVESALTAEEEAELDELLD